MENKISEYAELVKISAEKSSLISVTFHSPKIKGEIQKIKGKLKSVSGRTVLQLETQLTEGRVTQENIQTDGINTTVEKLLDRDFYKSDLNYNGGSASLMSSKNGKVTLIKHGQITDGEKVSDGNNREKKRTLKGDERFLFEIGVSDKNGRVHDKMQAKFRQINRFCEYIAEAEGHLPREGTVYVADLCCGKSYLSFAAYHTLTEVLHRETVMYCVDLKESVIEYCAGVADKCNMTGMKFIAGDITAFEPKGKIDMVISLHACDTATDIVIDKAIQMGAGVILSTPCCHRELSENIDCPPLHFISSRPLLSQKLCTAATDALRLMRMEAAGYDTDCTELIDPENTPKNIMLRGYKRGRSEKYLAEKQAEYEAVYKFLYGKNAK